MTQRRVAIGGLPYFGQMLTGLLAAEGWQFRYLESAGRRPVAWVTTATALAQADLVYLVGGQIERWSRPDWLARVPRRPIVMHWVGSDVTYAIEAQRRGRASQRLRSGPTHWTEVPWTAAELHAIGVEADVVPLTSTRLLQQPVPLPKQFTVLTYLPGSRPEFYGSATVLHLASQFPEVQFLVAGSAGLGPHTPANVEFLGWVDDMVGLYARSSVLLRLPAHDGLSFMVLEAMAAGRYVIWNHPMKGVLEVTDELQARSEIEALLALHRSGGLGPNEAGRRTIQSQFAPERIGAEILGRFERILAQR